MMKNSQPLFKTSILLVSLALSACGGGGGSTSSPEPQLSEPALAAPAAQALLIDTQMQVLSLTNTGGAELTQCSADSLPLGLVVAVSADANTCDISGTPTEFQAATTHTITATNAAGSSNAAIDVSVVADLALPELANISELVLFQRKAFNASLTNIGGGQLTDCTANALPAGLTVAVTSDASTCDISGTPTDLQAATTHTITATNVAGSSNLAVEISVVPDLALPELTGISALVLVQGQAFNASLANIGGGQLTDCTANSLPLGLAVAVSADSNTCDISGIPTDLQVATTHTITATNSAGSSNTTVDITVVITSPSLSDVNNLRFAQGQLVDLVLENTGGGELSECVADILPAGFEVAPSADDGTCHITGEANLITDSSSFNVTATNAGGISTATISFQVVEITPYITTWNTANEGASDDNQITIQVSPDFTYNYTVDWGDGKMNDNVQDDITHTYDVPGVYEVTISGTYPQPFFADIVETDALKLLTVEQWGNRGWLSMEQAFLRADNLVINDTENPDLSRVTSLRKMFERAGNFDSDISGWDVSSVTDMSYMLGGTEAFNQDIGSWDVSNVTDMSFMFREALAFNQDIGSWIVSNVTHTVFMFAFAIEFNQDISFWDVSNVTDMSGMLVQTMAFNQDIGSWVVSSVTDMSYMFYQADIFNQDIGGWDVSSVTNMSYMFFETAAFNQDIGSWDVSNVTDMSSMFRRKSGFNQDIGRWDVSSVTDMSDMFSGAAFFNQDIGEWDVSNVTDMSFMFSSASSFNQDLSVWDISKVTDMSDFLLKASLSTTNYDALLNSWSALTVQQGLNFSVGTTKFSPSSQAARDVLINDSLWSITDGGLVAP